MPSVNPAIMVWARETAGLTQEEAAKKLDFQDSSRSSAVEKLARIEQEQKEPSRPQLVKMEEQYRRPLLTFYLSKPSRSGANRKLPDVSNDFNVRCMNTFAMGYYRLLPSRPSDRKVKTDLCP